MRQLILENTENGLQDKHTKIVCDSNYHYYNYYFDQDFPKEFLSLGNNAEHFKVDERDKTLYNDNGTLVNIMDLKGYDVEEEHKIITEIITTLSNLYEDLEFSVVREPIVYYEKWQFQDYILNGSKVNEKTSTHSIYCTNKEMVRRRKPEK